MNSAQDTSGIKNPRALSGILVYDALMLRDGIVGSNPKPRASVQATGQRTSRVNK